ncbi:hypothetical protein FNF28_00270 [Cafeteria roenbergensis]|uniref:Complex 1 LYR protein domain-containing protein n=2 Tax=Cafeteria roenbergensis TaxID=33653 RepID=A0A5A8E2D1_CAFRO|nr:hypothetical protein FNF28_00270 [Cafeteria roenbergensis]
MASVTIKARRFARGDILGMYKECLTLVRSFPSIKREELFQDIRTEFREKASLDDPEKIAHAVEVAMRGIATMRKYTGVESKGARWTLDLEQDPLGQAFHEQRRAEEEEARQRAQADGKADGEPKERLSLQELQRRADALAAREDALREEEGDVLRVTR